MKILFIRCSKSREHIDWAGGLGRIIEVSLNRVMKSSSFIGGGERRWGSLASGKSGLRGKGSRVIPGYRKVTESAAENIPPQE